jgi:predicted Zn-dependent protease
VAGDVIRSREAVSGSPLNRSTVIGATLVICCLSSLAEAAREAATSPADQAPRISTEEFPASPFARFYQAQDYPNALAALDALLNTYPDDPLILRYRARVLARLGRTKDAIALYQRLLTQDPRHAPTRVFLGEAYLGNG